MLPTVHRAVCHERQPESDKTIGKFLRLSMFANKIIDYTPDYYSNGYKIRRNVSPYFGVEANLTF